MWSAQIHDTQTGNRLGTVKLAAGEWGRGDQVMRSSQIVLNRRRSQSSWRDLIVGPGFWDRTLVILFDGVPIYAGLILAAPSWRPATNILTVRHVDLSVLLGRRWMHGVGPSTGGGGYVPSGSFSVSGVSLRGALRAILQRTYLDPISAAWPVPVDLPASETGSFSKTWYFYEFQNAADMIRELVEQDGGPDIDLRPYLTSGGKLRWEQRIGTPRVTGPGHKLMLSAERNAAAAWDVSLDGVDTATGIHFPGKGTERDMRVGSAAAPVSAGLARDSISTDKNDDNVASLSAKAAGRLTVLKAATEERSFTIATSKISPANVQIGSIIQSHSYGDLWMPDGYTSDRVVGFSGSYGRGTFDLKVEAV